MSVVAMLFAMNKDGLTTTSVRTHNNASTHAAATTRRPRSTTMIEADILRLSSIPWAAALINDKRWTPTLSSNRVVKRTGEDSFFAETLDTGRTIRTMLMLRPTQEQEGDFVYEELLVILDLGDGLNGYPQVLHGGFAATLLDETCGGLIQLNVFEKVRRLGSQHAMNYLTAYLNTVYKKPVPVPGPVLCTAKIERHDGRKVYVRATVEDGEGTVYTTGECLFIEAKPKL
ncbi:hypothetical protein OPT61_g5483 [Boeremia exigua]|uniref:Uncharacterized protein n=1 Tax=Boeremia exigua TaxID=749465 RepID=A0ACC2IA98_9PLEO|nr:hypothetical protein OPT61_g5483 [Boeremia exigua]